MKWINGIGISIGLIFLQVFLIDKLPFLGFCHPFIYIYLLLLMPIQWPRWLQTIGGAALGLVMDMFANSPGVHMAACVLFSYMRPLLLQHAVQDSSRLNGAITLDSVGEGTFLRLTALLVTAHHLILFMLDAFTFHRFWMTIILTILSAVISYGLILMAEFLRKANE